MKPRERICVCRTSSSWIFFLMFCSILPPTESGKSDSAPDQPDEDDDEVEDLAGEDHLAYTDDLRDENYHPSLDR